jgi:hypothetical protein
MAEVFISEGTPDIGIADHRARTPHNGQQGHRMD